jgi:hypothetical protein
MEEITKANTKDNEGKRTRKSTYYLIVEEWIVGCMVER